MSIHWNDYIKSGDFLRKLSGKLYEESKKAPDRFKDYFDPLIDKQISKLPGIIEAYKYYQYTQMISIKDVRQTLPWNGKWKQRNLEDIYWIILHQAIGFAYENRSNTAAINNFHIVRQKINGKWFYGWPHIAYHFAVDRGKDYIDWCNSLEDITYGAGGGWNSKSIHVIVPGDFAGPTNIGKQDPTQSQLKRTGLICDWLISRPDLPNLTDRSRVCSIGHFEATGKKNCPGYDIMDWLKNWRVA